MESQLILEIDKEILSSGSKPNFNKIAEKVGVPVTWVWHEYNTLYDHNERYYGDENENV